MRSRSPNGVRTLSKAIDPTTVSDTARHSDRLAAVKAIRIERFGGPEVMDAGRAPRPRAERRRGRGRGRACGDQLRRHACDPQRLPRRAEPAADPRRRGLGHDRRRPPGRGALGTGATRRRWSCPPTGWSRSPTRSPTIRRLRSCSRASPHTRSSTAAPGCRRAGPSSSRAGGLHRDARRTARQARRGLAIGLASSEEKRELDAPRGRRRALARARRATYARRSSRRTRAARWTRCSR